MARKTATFVKCDESTCTVHAEVHEQNEAPEGWYLILPSLEDQKVGHSYSRAGSFEFHSLRCVERWAKDRRMYQERGEVRTPRSTVNDSETESRINTVMQALRIEPETSMSITELVSLTGLSKHYVDDAVSRLIDSGIVVQSEERSGPKPSKYKLEV